MSKSKKESLSRQARDRFNEMIKAGKGTAKHDDKHGQHIVRDGVKGTPVQNKIYTDGVKRQYQRDFKNHFEPWAKDAHPDRDSIDDWADPKLGQEYVDYLIEQGYSPSTVSTYYAAAAKACGWSRKDVELPARTRADAQNNRGDKPSDRHYSSANHAEIETVIKSTGLRRSEIERIRGSDLHQGSDGRYYVDVKGKGGKIRSSVVIGSADEIRTVVDAFQGAGNDKVLPGINNGKSHISKNCNPHAMRAEYAVRCYKAAAGIDGKATMDHAAYLSRDQRYDCRKDYAGISLDRDAVEFASHQLGHESTSEPVGHYLYGLVAEMRAE